MVSHNGSEGVQPRNMTKLHWAKGFTIWKPVALHAIKGECVSDVPGSQTIAGHSTVHSGTWESHTVPKEASNKSKRRRRKYGGMAVGPGHIRVTDGVMPIQSRESGTLEGVSSKM